MKKLRLLFLSGLTLILLSAFSVSIYASGQTDDVTPDNGIPVMYLNIDESQGTIEDMLNSPDHSVYCYGTVSITVPEGFHYADFPDNICESVTNLSMSIRGRGNSTWRQASKKPYKIKLDKKTDLFGLGKNKHWVLVANSFDASLLKDRITAWLGDQLGFEFTPRGVPVDVVMTGENFGNKYLGSFYLSENVRVDDNRLEIDELKEDDTEEPTITGGYLLQNSVQLRADSPDRFYTRRGVQWGTDTPSFDTEADSLADESPDLLEGVLFEENFTLPELGDAYKNSAQQQYIQRHIQRIEDSLYEEGYGYRKLMDLESAAKYWLINIVPLNDDAYSTGSTYIYKKRDVNGVTGKLYWGPIWDFDFAWDHRMTTEGFRAGHLWTKALFCDKGEGGFLEEVKKYWPKLKTALEELTKDGGIIDQYYEETKRSADADRIVNPPLEPDLSYHYHVEHLKNWIKDRTAWVTENIDLLDDLVHQVTYLEDGEFFAKDFMENDGFSFIDGTEEHPEKEGYVFTGWIDENGNPVDPKTPVDRDMTLTAAFIPEKEATKAVNITFRRNDDVVVYDPNLPYYTLSYQLIPDNAQDKRIEWSSSDESIASVDQKGVVTYYSEGEVTITAKLKMGFKRSIKLKITSEDLALPTSVSPEKKSIRLTEGNEAPIILNTSPASVKVDYYDYSSDNEEVATVDEFGVIKAVGPGTATISITTVTNGKGWGQRAVLNTEVKVGVTALIPSDESGPSEVPTSEGDIRPTTQPKPESNPVLGAEKDGDNSTEAVTDQETKKASEEVSENSKIKEFLWTILPVVLIFLIIAAVLFVRKSKNKM